MTKLPLWACLALELSPQLLLFWSLFLLENLT